LRKRRSASARPRHPTEPLPLLPSGPDGVYDGSSRGDRRGPTYSNRLTGPVRAGRPARSRFAATTRSGAQAPEEPRRSGSAFPSGWHYARLWATLRAFGEVAERSKALAWKASVR